MEGSKHNIVAETCKAVAALAQHVRIDYDAVNSVADSLTAEKLNQLSSPQAFDAGGLHFSDNGPLTVQYLLVVDALNYCFWPDGELEYEHLSKGIKASVQRDPDCINAQRLACISPEGVRALLGWHKDLPQQAERARLLREVGAGLLQHYGGQASALVQAAGRSALQLVHLVTAHFPGFRDHAVYNGQQVFFYKRAQIFIADVWGGFKGQGLGAFDDIDALTMFADYRVPVVLKHMGILHYSDGLQAKVDAKEVLPAGGSEEVEIRAATVSAVEALRDALQARWGPGVGSSSSVPVVLPHAVQLDWWLWETGEATRATDPPHHRTLTVYY